jgi:hypothetical protein
MNASSLRNSATLSANRDETPGGGVGQPLGHQHCRATLIDGRWAASAGKRCARDSTAELVRAGCRRFVVSDRERGPGEPAAEVDAA